MRILVVNDDGIEAKGILELAKLALQLGEVWVAAPKSQCSAMSHRIHVFGKMEVKRAVFPLEHVQAFSVDGTPADCVKIALTCLMPQKPDYVFSGINYGYNAGVDILYSGTVGAAMEALVNGIPAIAFSSGMGYNYEIPREKLIPVTKEIMKRETPKNCIWNVNFPLCSLSALKGVKWDVMPSSKQFYRDNYEIQEKENGSFFVVPHGMLANEAEEGTDVRAVLDGYIAIGKIRNGVVLPQGNL